MKRGCVVLLAWWFLVTGKSSGFSEHVFVVVGPFKERAICEQVVEADEKACLIRVGVLGGVGEPSPVGEAQSARCGLRLLFLHATSYA